MADINSHSNDTGIELTPPIEIVSDTTQYTFPGIDWDNDDLFFTYEWEDETSQFDPKGKWHYGGEYYSRIYRARVPVAFKNSDEMSWEFVEMMMDKYPDTQGFWRE